MSDAAIDERDEAGEAAGPEAEEYDRVWSMPLYRIIYETDRAHGGLGDIGGLAESMKRFGQIHPIAACREEIGRYRIIAGRRRFEAAKLLGWETIDAVARSAEEAEEISLAENVDREDMNPLDEAIIFQKQLAGGRDISELAQYYNRSASAIYQRVKLTRLTGDLKEFFRAGKIGITAAAMLASLDEKLQQKFYAKYRDWNDVGVHQAEDFLHSVQHNRLICIADKKCAGCDKRTFHSDANLFPEYAWLQDVCFDDGCYAQKWLALLGKQLKKEKAAHPDTENILVLEGIPKFYKGNTLTIGKDEYRVKKYGWQNQAHENAAGAFGVWVFNAFGNKLTLEHEWYKETAKEKERAKDQEPESKFETGGAIGAIADEKIAVQFEDEDPGSPSIIEIRKNIKKEELKRIDGKLAKKFSSPYDLENKIRAELMKQSAREFAEAPCNFSREVIGDLITNDDTAELYEIITGIGYAEGLAGIEHADPLKVVALLFFIEVLDDYDWPDPEHEEDGDGLVYRLPGLSRDRFAERYKDTARKLVNDALESVDEPDVEDEEEEEENDAE